MPSFPADAGDKTIDTLANLAEAAPLFQAEMRCKHDRA
jgi:hypothetical protein